MLRRLKLDGPSTKVVTSSAIYVWTQKTWSFDKLHKVGDFPTRFTLSLKAIKFSSRNLGLDGRDFMLSFHTVRDCCGLGFEPEIDVSEFGLLVW